MRKQSLLWRIFKGNGIFADFYMSQNVRFWEEIYGREVPLQNGIAVSVFCPRTRSKINFPYLIRYWDTIILGRNTL